MLEEAASAILADGMPAEAVVEQTYRAALSRPPNAGEAALAMDLIAQGTPEEGMADFLWTIFVQPEFFYIR
jgi:hypothetical protein